MFDPERGSGNSIRRNQLEFRQRGGALTVKELPFCQRRDRISNVL